VNNNQTIYIVDDDPDVLDAMSMLLQSTGLTTKTHHSGQDFLDNNIPLLIGCVILDVRMPNMSGLQLQLDIKRKNPTLPVVFVTGHGDVPMAVQAMKNGAIEFLQKPFRDQEFIDCVHRALYINNLATNEREHLRSIQDRIDSLTKREHQIMRHIADGDMTKIIANKLNISPRTVEIHRARAMEKMRVKTVAQLVHIVMESEAQ
jgi:FixJ family two-component response regulator